MPWRPGPIEMLLRKEIWASLESYEVAVLYAPFITLNNSTGEVRAEEEDVEML